jgi:small membrane protein
MIIFAQVFLLSLVVLALGLVILRYRQNKISTRGFLLWLVLWVGVTAVIMFPNSTIVVARLLGIGRGTDLVLYTSIILILYFLFRVYVHLEQVDKEITQIVRALALRDEELIHSKSEENIERNTEHRK